MRFRPKVIERGDNYRIIAMPIYFTEAMMKEAGEHIRKDAAVQGRELKVTVGHRLMRIEGDLLDEKR